MRLTATRSSITSGGGAVLDSIQQEDPSLDLQFAENKNLTNEVDGDNLVTFSRASTATYVDSNGVIQSASSNTARFDHDPATGESLGLLIEESRTNLLTHSEEFDNSAWTKERTTVTSNAISAPDGTNTADLIVEDTGTGSHSCKQTESLTGGASYVLSAYVKANSLDHVFLDIYDSNFTPRAATFDLTAGTSADATGSPTSHSIVDVGSGWYRVSMVFTAPTTSLHTIEIRLTKDGIWANRSYTGTGESLYVWGAQLEAGSFPTSYIPTSGSTVTRAADVAEITGANFAKTNLLQYTERVEPWNQYKVVITPNQEITPDGTITADKVAENTETDEHFVQRNVTPGGSGVYTHSVFVKSAGRPFVSLRPVHVGESTSTSSCEFDLTTGTAGPTAGIGFNPTITAYPNGWYRISLSVTLTGVNTIHGIRVHLYDGSSTSYQGDGASGLYVWGAQIEEGSVLTEYTPSVESFTSRASTATYVDDTTGLITTAAVDEARYKNGELILEEARTNHVKFSEDITSFRWFTANTVTRTANQINSPDGTLTADKIELPAGSSAERVLQSSSLSGTAIGTQITSSCFLKAAEHSYARVEMQGGGNTSSVNVDLSDGSLISQVNSPDSYKIEPYPDNWYRISVTSTTSTTATTALRVYIVDASGNKSFTGTVGDGFYVWGGQHEVGGFASSYIPTVSVPVTRAADVSTSALGVDSWYNQSEGTVFVDGSGEVVSVQRLVGINDGTDSNRHELLGTPTVIQLFQKNNGVNEVGVTSAKAAKAAFAYASNDYRLSVGGGSVVTDTSATPPTVDRMSIGNWYNNTGQLNGHIKRLSYFKTRLPDATLQDITGITTIDVSLSFLEYVTTASTSSFTLLSAGTVDYEVNWGDGTTESLTTNNPTHTYSSAGKYTIKITPAAGSTYRPDFNDNVSDTSIESISGTGGSQLGNNLQFAWRGANNMTSFSGDIDTSSVTNFNGAWRVCNSLTSFPLIDTSSGTSFSSAWYSCTSLTSFPLIDTSSGTSFSSAWFKNTSLTSFPLIDTSSGTNLRGAWRNCSSLTSFPLIDTSSSTTFYQTWQNCSSLTSFPLINTAAGTLFNSSWQNCSSLTSFPLIDTSSGTNFNQCWRNCTSLTSFPANMFDTTGTLVSGAFNATFVTCALTAQSIENILVSLDTNGASNITLGINGGTNAAKTTWSTAANTAYTNLINKGWTISYNA